MRCVSAVAPSTVQSSLVRVRASPSVYYERRRPEDGVLYQTIQDHLETFLRDAAEAHDGVGVPRFVEEELRAFLRCGMLAHGFCRFKCTDCRHEQLVALSCKGRGFCSSCGSKRMTDIAAHLVDHVIPAVPVRQFVLSLPHRLRYLLAYNHERCTAVLAILIRVLLQFYRSRAHSRGVHGGRTGSVTFIQRFGSAANLNLHFHVLVIDGVFTEERSGELAFHAAPPPTTQEVTELLTKVHKRIQRHLGKHGLLDDDHANLDALSEQAPLLADCYTTSIAHRQTLGTQPGAPLASVGRDPNAQWIERTGALQAHFEGFDLHAKLAVATQRPGGQLMLEKLVRYCARPPLAKDRLHKLPDGRIALELKTPWFNGTTHVIYEPVDFLAKLAALVPRPHKNLVIYHGVISPHARWRTRVIAYGRKPDACEPASAAAADSDVPPHKRNQWTELMRRAFGYDLLSCPKCGGKMVLLACIMERAVIAKILKHLGLPSEPPRLAKARAAPGTQTRLEHVA